MNELRRLLKILPSPANDGKEFIKVSCGVGFEPHGRASETWEIYWKLELPEIPLYWKSTKGWKKHDGSRYMIFYGRTFDIVVARAVKFIKTLAQETK